MVSYPKYGPYLTYENPTIDQVPYGPYYFKKIPHS